MIPLGVFPLCKVPVQTGGLQPFAIPPPMLPFELLNNQNVRNQPLPLSEFNTLPQTIPFTLGAFGMVEVINYSPFLVNVTVAGANINTNQEPYSKCIYRASADAIGQVALVMTPLQCLFNFNSCAALGLSPVAICNSYQDGEIELYAPVALSIPSSLVCPQFTSFTNVAGQTVTVDGGAGGSYNPPVSDHWLLGFDFTHTSAANPNGGTLVIQNLCQTFGTSSGRLNYQIRAETINPTGSGKLIVRFPGPIPNNPGAQIQFVVPTFTGVTPSLNVYYLR